MFFEFSIVWNKNLGHFSQLTIFKQKLRSQFKTFIKKNQLFIKIFNSMKILSAHFSKVAIF